MLQILCFIAQASSSCLNPNMALKALNFVKTVLNFVAAVYQVALVIIIVEIECNLLFKVVLNSVHCLYKLLLKL